MPFFDRLKQVTKKKDEKSKMTLGKKGKGAGSQESHESAEKEIRDMPVSRERKTVKKEAREKSAPKLLFGAETEIGSRWGAVKHPRVSEKSTILASRSQYVFDIDSRAKKLDIKDAIQKSYGVTVQKVNIVSIPRKRRRLGRSEGYRSGYKKAIVFLKEGETIEVLPR